MVNGLLARLMERMVLACGFMFKFGALAADIG